MKRLITNVLFWMNLYFVGFWIGIMVAHFTGTPANHILITSLLLGVAVIGTVLMYPHVAERHTALTEWTI